jgi:hypothetical protein
MSEQLTTRLCGCTVGKIARGDSNWKSGFWHFEYREKCQGPFSDYLTNSRIKWGDPIPSPPVEMYPQGVKMCGCSKTKITKTGWAEGRTGFWHYNIDGCSGPYSNTECWGEPINPRGGAIKQEEKIDYMKAVHDIVGGRR